MRGGVYALGNCDLDAGGEHGNIDLEVCYEEPLIYPPPNRALEHFRVHYLGGGMSGGLDHFEPQPRPNPRYTPSTKDVQRLRRYAHHVPDNML